MITYTACTAGYDQLIEPKCDGDFHAFVEEEVTSEKWQTYKLIGDENLLAVLRAKKYKMLPHKLFEDKEISLYVDSNMEILSDPTELAEKYLADANIAFFRHPENRTCLYDEARVCKEMKKDEPEWIEKQADHYKRMGYPENNGLVAGMVILRRHNEPDVVKVMEEWWAEVNEWSFRDQISFPYLAWKNKLKFNVIDDYVRDCKWFKWRKHL